MKTNKTKSSWKTSLAGALNGLSTAIMGASIVPGLTDMSTAIKMQPVLITAFIIKAASEFFAGWAARDNDVTSEDAGLVVFPDKTQPVKPVEPNV